MPNNGPESALSAESEKKLSVYYDGPPDQELDKKIMEVLESQGWIWLGSGTELSSGERDLAFYKKITK